MEEDSYTKTAEKAVIQGEEEKKEALMVAAFKVEPEEEKIDVDTGLVIGENAEKDFSPLVLKVETESEDLVTLRIEGIETGDDNNEEFVIMSPEEIRIFLEQKISEHVRDPQVNPLLTLEKRMQDLLDEIKDKAEETSKLNKALETLYKNQERFLRHMKIFPKIPTRTVAVSVDLPLLKESVPLVSPSNVDEKAVIRKDMLNAKVSNPSISRAEASSTIPNCSISIPSAISVTPVPSTSSSIPAVPKASRSVPVYNLATTVKSLLKIPPKPVAGFECVDLTDDLSIVNPIPVPSPSTTLGKHPAPLPPRPFCPVPFLSASLSNVPPKPRLKISTEERGLVLQWDMSPCYSASYAYSKLKSFDIFGYQEQKNVAINALLWQKIGAVKAMSLPMACTLTQFLEGEKYHFSVRAVDVYDRCGSYSDPISIVFRPSTGKKRQLQMT